MTITTHIKFGDGLAVTDEGSGVIRVDGSGGPAGATGPAGPNLVDGSTPTPLTGLLKGNGTDIDVAVAGTDYARPTGYGTSLPGSPVDGQEHILVDSTTNPAYQWRLRYNSSSSSAYKWELVGGFPYVASSGAFTAVGDNAWHSAYAFTAPRAGEYMVRVTASGTPSAAAVLYAGAGSGGTVQAICGVSYQTTAGQPITVTGYDVVLTVAAGVVLNAMYNTSAGSTANSTTVGFSLIAKRVS